MDVAILYSGGKDSTYAIEYCQNKNWNIKYLISVKPSRTDCYLYHYATVEHTKEIAKILGYKHILKTCNVANPEEEARIVKEVVQKNPVDAIILGGTGLQETQVKSIQDSLKPLKVKAFASHLGENHGLLFENLVKKGYEILISQVASDGLMPWLGRIVTKENFPELKKMSEKYGFHLGFEGGYADTLVLNAPFFKKRLEKTS